VVFKNADDLDLQTGMLLVATPALKDPNFEKTVILLSAHDEENGTLGVIINKPTHKTLGECVDEFRGTELADTEIYVGGPVQSQQLILSCWQWSDSHKDFRFYFGISRERAADLLRDHPDNVEIRGYLGYAGWGKDQLETEISDHAWYTFPVDPVTILKSKSPIAMWQKLAWKHDRVIEHLLDIPEDPSLN
jgi:putative transcriptional regulator